MALHRILVVDDSPAVRETLSILLGADHEVEAASPADVAANGLARVPGLIIATRPAYGSAKVAAHFPPGVPVLWLEPGLGSGTSGSPRLSPRTLREQVAGLLAGPPPAPAGVARLAPPFVPAGVARVALEALRTPLPLHLLGEPGVGKRALARAIHAAAGSGAFVAVTGGAFDLAALTAAAPSGGTVFIDRVDHLSSTAQHALLAALDASGRVPLAGEGSLRLVTATSEDLDAAAERGAFLPDLYYRLTIFSARLPALRERAADVPALAAAIAAELAVALGRGAVTLSEAAQTRLRNYLWFGNLAELEAVLARSIALAPGAALDADDLRFEPQRSAPAGGGGAAVGNGHDGLAGHSLDLIINELAHEFKNPLVTIKTFAHHLRRTRPDGADDAQVARLTGEAVEQIDQTLENLLEFTRLDSPAPRALALSSVLDPVLADCSRALGARGVRLDHDAMPSIGVRGDPQQLAYALSNLVRSVSRDLPAGARVRIAYAPPASLTLELPNGSAPYGSHLATLLDRPADAAHAMPLGVAIANAVLERNGAQVAVATETPSIISVRFSLAGAEETAAANGSAPRIGR